MRLFGLTGQTGSGKSSIAEIFKKHGFFVCDGDELARAAVQKGSPVLEGLAQAFGRDVINPDGTLNRALTAHRAFSSPENTKKLNSITHTRIYELLNERLEWAAEQGFTLAVLDAAALLESPMRGECEKIIVVYAPRSDRLERIIKRDSISVKSATERMNAQGDDEYYLSAADMLIKNYPPFDPNEQTLKIIEEIKNEM